MNRHERVRYRQEVRRAMEAKGYRFEDDGAPVVLDLAGRAGALLHALLVTGFLATAGAFLAGAAGLAIGLVLAAIGLWHYRRQPEPTRRERLRAWLLGTSPVTGAVDYALTYAFVFAIYGGLGALLGLAFGLPLPGAIAGCCLGSWLAAQPDDMPELPDHGNVHGGSAMAGSLDEIEDAGLYAGGASGLFVAAVEHKDRVQDEFERARRGLHNLWLWFRGETSALVIAPPSSGKGVASAIATGLANREDSKGFVDPKGQIAAICVPWLRDTGHQVVVFNPTGLLRAEFDALGVSPAACNVLGLLDPDNPNTETAVSELIAAAVPVRSDDHNPFFAGAAQELCSAVALHARETLGAAADLPRVAAMLHAPDLELNRMFGAMRDSRRFRSVRASGHKYHMPLTEDGKLLNLWTNATRDVFTTAQRETAFLLKGGVAAMFSEGTASFDFAAMKRQKCAVFVCVPEGAAESVQKATHLLLAAMKSALLVHGGRPVLLLVDELCTALPESATGLMQTLYSFARGFGVKVVGYAQSWPQFVAWAGSEQKANALRASAGCAIFYGANDPETSAYIRKQAGSYTIWTPNSDPFAELEKGTTPMGVELLRDEELRAIHRDGKQVIFLLGARRVVVLPRTSYRDIPELAARAAPDPYHP